MNTKLFVGNLPFKTTEADLTALFSRVAGVVSVAIPTDRQTGRKRGFAFVEMETEQGADDAVKALNGNEIDGRQIVVNPAKERQPKTGGGGGGRFAGSRY